MLEYVQELIFGFQYLFDTVRECEMSRFMIHVHVFVDAEPTLYHTAILISWIFWLNFFLNKWRKIKVYYEF